MLCVECHCETKSLPCSGCAREPRLDGRYALVERIGGGASGVVFKALDTERGETVAVKELLLGGLEPDQARSLAKREVLALRRLSHDGLPVWRQALVQNVGRSSALYLVRSFVEGVDLEGERHARPWSETEVLLLMVEILDICEYLHGRVPSVVHRDIKPANLIRQPDGRLVLVDFGSVRDTLRDAVSGGGSVAGTVGFMAPEQLAGQVEPASDLYAIAMTAVTLLAREEPVALHDRAGRPCWEHMVSVSEGTIKLLRAMLEADPARRPQSAAVVRGYIEQLIVADEDARNNADIGPTLVPTPSPLFDGPTGVHGRVFDEPTGVHEQALLALTGAHQPPLRIEPHEPARAPADAPIVPIVPNVPVPNRGVFFQTALAVTALAVMLGVGLGFVL